MKFFIFIGVIAVTLSEVIKKIGNTYHKVREKERYTKDNNITKLVEENMVRALLEIKGIKESNEYEVVGSAGKGQFTHIPWVAIRNPIISTTAQKGIYIVFLFSADGKELYLTLNQGTKYLEDKGILKHGIKTSNLIYRMISAPRSKQIKIDLKSGYGKDYEKATISGFKYSTQCMPDVSIIKRDLNFLLEDYNQIIDIYKYKYNQNIDQFYKTITNKIEDEYNEFKILLNEFLNDNYHYSVCIDQIEFNINILNSTQKQNEKKMEFSYINYSIADRYLVVAKPVIKKNEINAMKIVLYDKKYNSEKILGKKTGYEIKKMKLKSNNIENELKNFYDQFINVKKEVKSIMKSKLIKDVTDKLITSKNIILRGSPGTGKSYLSKAVASKIIDIPIEELECSDQFEFVQFHPSYDYTDFVEGIRPTVSQTGEIGFELRSGIFKEFCSKAVRSLNNSENKKFVFVIDEINRGEISKIFGELFFSIDPSYRGKKGSVKTQYTNMEKSEDKFYIPDNVYIIGTMNDIDRSIDTFDFAMRRRFRFIKIEANENTQMLEVLGDKKNKAIERMIRLNEAISSVEELNSNYHIGAAYFLKLRSMTFDELWKDYLQPLLADYIRGMFNEEDIMNKFESAYYSNSSKLGENNEEA